MGVLFFYDSTDIGHILNWNYTNRIVQMIEFPYIKLIKPFI